MMSSVMFAWELGANLGHLTRDLPLARRCRDAGHRVVMAVSNLRAAVDFLKGEQFTIVQAPVLRPHVKRTTFPINYPDLLLHTGYDDDDALKGAVTGWLGLIDVVRPSLLVYNHAPTALLAARMRRLPVMMIGTGFEIPPNASVMPTFRPWQDISQSALLQAEEAAVTYINRQLTAQGGTALERMADLFAGDTIHLTTFAELDPFGPRPGVDYVGPVYALPKSPVVTWEGVKKRRIFAYLHPRMVSCEQFLAAFERLDAEFICVISGAPPEWSARFAGLRLIPRPVDLDGLLKDADLAITYGAGTIATALHKGVPVLLIPQALEQYLAGLAMEKSGAGIMLQQPNAVAQCVAMINDLLANSQYRQAAWEFCKRYSEFNTEQTTECLVNVIEKIVSIDAASSTSDSIN